jgi:hypothetical protein
LLKSICKFSIFTLYVKNSPFEIRHLSLNLILDVLDFLDLFFSSKSQNKFFHYVSPEMISFQLTYWFQFFYSLRIFSFSIPCFSDSCIKVMKIACKNFGFCTVSNFFKKKKELIRNLFFFSNSSRKIIKKLGPPNSTPENQ